MGASERNSIIAGDWGQVFREKHYNWVMEIRPYQPHHAPALVGSYNALYEKPITVAAFVDQMAALVGENGRCWTITDPQNQPVGYASVEPVTGLPGLAELDGLIDPRWQRRGLGSRLLAHVCRELAGGPMRQLSHSLTDLNSPAASFLRHHRFQLSHQEHNLLLTGWDNLPPLQPPTPQSRVASLGQVDQARSLFNRLYGASFAPHAWHQPYSPAELAVTLKAAADLRFLWQGQQAIGFVWLHYPAAAEAEIEPMGIVPEKQGMGYGRYLLLDTCHYLRRRQIERLHLGVWASNKVALSLYEQFGFRHNGTRSYLTLQI
jgi:ribosomal protein S18 acetylase RimI-like enzyme